MPLVLLLSPPQGGGTKVASLRGAVTVIAPLTITGVAGGQARAPRTLTRTLAITIAIKMVESGEILHLAGHPTMVGVANGMKRPRPPTPALCKGPGNNSRVELVDERGMNGHNVTTLDTKPLLSSSMLSWLPKPSLGPQVTS